MLRIQQETAWISGFFRSGLLDCWSPMS
jgi:hypothetical protein